MHKIYVYSQTFYNVKLKCCYKYKVDQSGALANGSLAQITRSDSELSPVTTKTLHLTPLSTFLRH